MGASVSFPVDDVSLDLLYGAVHIDPGAERSSLFDVLDMFSRLSGSDLEAVESTLEGVPVMRDPTYTVNDVLAALIGEIRRLRGILGPEGARA